jgi:hypothetical protein
MATPITYQYVKTLAGVIEIPIYSITDVPLPIIRINTPSGIGCYDLVEPTINTPIRVNTHLGVKGINLTPADIVNLIDYANYNLVGALTTLVDETEDYIQINASSNGNGIGFPFTANIGDTLSANVNVDIVQGVDDVMSIRLWNITQSKWITTNFKTGTIVSGLHNLSNTFTLSSTHLVDGDELEFRVVQSWKNNTHDTFVFKVMKNSILSK